MCGAAAVFASVAAAACAVGVGEPVRSTPSWNVVHQWTPSAVNITLLSRPGVHVGNVSARWRILHVTDAHISLGEAIQLHRTGTRRMHDAFRTPQEDKHLEKGKRRLPIDTFKKLLDLAQKSSADVVVLGGDILNFPHNESVQSALQELRSLRTWDGLRMPVIFTAGNHDWFVEALGRPLREQRSRFRREVLHPLYKLGLHSGRGRGGELGDFDVLELCRGSGASRPCGSKHSSDDHRLLILSVDNSIHEISLEQTDFVRRHLARGWPTLLIVHVPFMLPDATPRNTKTALCGDPRYRYDQDSLWRIERRERWPVGGPSASTLRFVEDLVNRFASPRGPLLGVLSGHEHLHRADTLGRKAHPALLSCDNASPPRCRTARGMQFGLPVHEGFVQYVTAAGFEGGHRLVEIIDARDSPLWARRIP
eukprot:TRINITY_DN55483_c0_g1_i1.p1 TRINITY_DN55483_c0_g1~~TRINITY_DN55483_c0_g1_i1.p1  ORF type:complete len:423 (-),score=67.57 TRINITY_DN55483_c0_g1_i1:139-1407(-)